MSTNQDFPHEATYKEIVHCDGCGTCHIIIPPSKEYSSPIDCPGPRIDYQKSYFDCKKLS